MQNTGNTILITGGTSGIGFELAKQLQGLGNTVIVTGRDAARLDEVRASLPGVHALRSDVTDAVAIDRLFVEVTARFPALNVLINNAGIMRVHDLTSSTSPTELTKEIETNLMAPIWMVQRFLAHLTSKPNATIVNVTSGLAFVPLAVAPIYGATKAGLHSYTQALRAQLRGSTVEVIELAPPATTTPLLRMPGAGPMMAVDALVKAAIKGFVKSTPLITPGLALALRTASRVAPSFVIVTKNSAAMFERSAAQRPS